MGALSVLMELKADPSKATEALEGFRGKIEGLTQSLAGNFGSLGGGITSALGGIAPVAGLAVGAVGAVGGAMFEMANKASEAGEQMLHLSEQTGISTRTLGGLKLAAQLAGLDFNQLTMGFAHLATNISPFTQASAQGKLALKGLGVQTQDTHGQLLPMDNILGQIADKFSKMPDGTTKASLAASLFGSRIGLQLIPVLDKGSKGIAELTAKAKQMGISFSQEGAEKAEQFQDSLKILKDTMAGFEMELGEKAIPIVEGMGKALYIAWGFVKGFATGLSNAELATAKWLYSLPGLHQVLEGIGWVVQKLWDGLKGLWSIIEKGIGLIYRFTQAHKELGKVAGLTGIGQLWAGITGGIQGATQAAADFNAKMKEAAQLGAAESANAGPLSTPALAGPEHSKKAKAAGAHYQKLNSETYSSWLAGATEAAIEAGIKAQQAATKKATEMAPKLAAQAQQYTEKQTAIISGLTNAIQQQANATVKQGEAANQTVGYTRTLSQVKSKLADLYPMLTQSQIEYASTLLAGDGQLQRDIILKQNQSQVTQILTGRVRELFGVQAMATKQQFSFNQAIFEGNTGLAKQSEVASKNAAGILQQLGMKKAYAAVMAIYEAAVGFEALAEFDFWKSAQAFVSSAMYAKVAGTSTPHGGGGSHGGAGGGGRSTSHGPAGLSSMHGNTAPSGPHTVVNIQGMVSPDTLSKLAPQLTAVLNQSGHAGTITLASQSTSSIPAPKA